MRTSTPAAVLTVMVLLLAGCNKPAEPVRSWVGGDSQTEVMIKFTGPADSLQGTLDYTVVKPDDPQGAAGAQHLDFTGTIDGSLITLTFAEIPNPKLTQRYSVRPPSTLAKDAKNRPRDGFKRRPLLHVRDLGPGPGGGVVDVGRVRKRK